LKKWNNQLDILVNNAAEQHVCEDIADISEEQLESTFRTNIFAMFYLSQEAVKYMVRVNYRWLNMFLGFLVAEFARLIGFFGFFQKEGACIINSTSVTAFKGKANLLDYSSTKGAILAFTRSLSQNLASKGSLEADFSSFES
jgi:NAD(P)-dependent dehydrogenase (short-subunit alcohol dehydrogenase family)